MADLAPIKYENLNNRSIIITGGASGLGLATATLFAEHGAYITIADYDDAAGKKAETELVGRGFKVTFAKCDVTDWSSSTTAFKHAVNFSPRRTLDGAFLYAGVGGDARNVAVQVEMDYPNPSLEEDPEESSTRVLDINLGGLLKSTKLALYYFRIPSVQVDAEHDVAVGKKSLFLVASLAGYIDYDPTHYCVSKYGVRGLFRSLRIASKLPDSKFTVNLVAPGYTVTPLTVGGIVEDSPRQQSIKFVTDNNLWAPVEHVVQAAAICATNTAGENAVNGQSFGTWPHGLVDQHEDLSNGYGGSDLLQEAEKSRYLKFGLIKG